MENPLDLNPKTDTWEKTWTQVKNIEINPVSKIIFENIIMHTSFSDKSLLELGCGTGSISFLAYQRGAKEVTLVDFSNQALRLAKKLFNGIENVRFLKSDIFDLKLKQQYDIVLSSGVVEHFKGERLTECVKMHKKFSKDKVIIVAPASPHYNDIRHKLKSTKTLYGWQEPMSKRKMMKVFKKLGLAIDVNKRFYPLYGVPLVKKIGRKLNLDIDVLLKPLDSCLGGLLLTIGSIS